MTIEIKKKKNHMKSWIICYFVLLIILYVVIYAVPKVSGALTPTVLLTYDELRVWDEVTCYFVREEQVYNAKKPGVVTYYVPEGTLTRKGTKILDVNPVSGGAIENYRCQENGIVSYYMDGSESYFTPETMTQLTKADIKNYETVSKDTTRQSTLSGEPLYKLVDNSAWHLIYWIDQSKIGKYKKGNSVTVELPLDSITGTIEEIVDNGEHWLVVIRCDKYYEDMAKVRRVDATVVTEDYKGLLLPNESLVTVEGRVGVYVKQIGGDYSFTQVKVITTDGKSSLVQDSYFYEDTENGNVKVKTVELYDEILKSGKP